MWSSCRKFERKKRNRSQYFDNWVFWGFLSPCVFSLGLGDTIKGWAFQLSVKIPRTLLGCFYGNVVSESGNGALQWLETSLHTASRSSRPWTRRGKLPAVLWTSLQLQCCIHEKLHCARPIPGHGYDHTLLHQGVSVAGFHILFKQWFLCVYCWKNR